MSRRDYSRLRFAAFGNGSKQKWRKGTCDCPICIGRFERNRTRRERDARRFESVAG